MLINICVTCYLIFILSDFHNDLKTVKQTAKDTADIIIDTWRVMRGGEEGSAMAKVQLMKKYGRNVKNWMNRQKWRNKSEL